MKNIAWLNFAVSLGIGLLVGSERERNKRLSLKESSIGVRTFAIATLLGTVSALIHFLLLLFSISFVMLYVALAYQKQSIKHRGITTEVALVFVMVLGALCVEAPDVAAEISIIMVVLLSAKQAIHGFVLKILTQNDLNNFLILAASTLIILPLVPNDFVGPFHAINPHNLWLIVIIVMLISSISDIIIRFLDVRIGLPQMGLFSGFISSIATIVTMGKLAKESPALMNESVSSATFSSLSTILQLTILLAFINIQILNVLGRPLLLGGVSIFLYGLLVSFKSNTDSNPLISRISKSFNSTTALLLAAFIGIILIISAALKVWFGQLGLIVVSTIAGFADVHAPTIAVSTMAATGNLEASQTVLPILGAYSANVLSKAMVAIISSNAQFSRLVIIGLSIQLIAIWSGWFLM